MQLTSLSELYAKRVLGLPVQFVAVVALSLALTIFFGAWAADARIEARAQERLALAGSGPFNFQDQTGGQGAPLSGNLHTLPGGAEGERQAWESAFLFACPLH